MQAVLRAHPISLSQSRIIAKRTRVFRFLGQNTEITGPVGQNFVSGHSPDTRMGGALGAAHQRGGPGCCRGRRGRGGRRSSRAPLRQLGSWGSARACRCKGNPKTTSARRSGPNRVKKIRWGNVSVIDLVAFLGVLRSLRDGL